MIDGRGMAKLVAGEIPERYRRAHPEDVARFQVSPYRLRPAPARLKVVFQVRHGAGYRLGRFRILVADDEDLLKPPTTGKPSSRWTRSCAGFTSGRSSRPCASWTGHARPTS